MEIKVTVLCENCVFFRLGAIAEHGWAVYIETKHGNFLFDTGQGKAIINNAHFFRKDLRSLQGIIISHHHHDHTGGLMNVLEHSGTVKVYSHPELFKNSYSDRDGIENNIGIPFRREKLESKGAEFIFNTGWTEIVPGLMLSGEVPRKTFFEKGDEKLFLKTEKGYTKDEVIDDQTLIANTSKGLVIILGCSHAGIINILNYAIEKTGQSRIHTILGGTHLGPTNEEAKTKSIESLRKYNIERIGTAHCTGWEVSMRLWQEFGKRFFFCNVGTVVEV